jgi:hypothetical protein
MALRLRAEMPGDVPSRRNGWLAGVLAIAVITLTIAIMVPIEASPPRYPFTQRDATPIEIIVCIGVLLLETIAISLVLRGRGSPRAATRSIACSGMLLVLVLIAPRMMHFIAPLAIAWLGLFGAVWIVLALLWAIARRLTP